MKRIFFGIWILTFIMLMISAQENDTEANLKIVLIVSGIVSASFSMSICLIASGIKKLIDDI